MRGKIFGGAGLVAVIGALAIGETVSADLPSQIADVTVSSPTYSDSGSSTGTMSTTRSLRPSPVQTA